MFSTYGGFVITTPHLWASVGFTKAVPPSPTGRAEAAEGKVRAQAGACITYDLCPLFQGHGIAARSTCTSTPGTSDPCSVLAPGKSTPKPVI
jgi:hypothetical protein